MSKSCEKVLVKRDEPFLICTGFDNAYDYILERSSSEYTDGVPQSIIKEGTLNM